MRIGVPRECLQNKVIAKVIKNLGFFLEQAINLGYFLDKE